ncbi:MAG: hypothetical protein WBH03_10205 [Cyclobacteriaceae bacterium]
MKAIKAFMIVKRFADQPDFQSVNLQINCMIMLFGVSLGYFLLPHILIF